MKKIWNYIVEFFRTEHEKMKDLTFKKKLEYIWEYYKVHIIVTVCIVAAGISLTKTIVAARAGGEVVFGVGIVNDDNVTSESMAYFTSGFGEYLGLTYGEQQVKAAPGYSVGNTGMEYAEVLSIMLMVDAGAGNVDAAICQADVIEYFYDNEEAAWIDLSTVLSAEKMAELADQLYYAKDPSGNNYPCGIYLEEGHIFTEAGLTLKEPMIAFPAGAQHADYIDDFVDYVLGD